MWYVYGKIMIIHDLSFATRLFFFVLFVSTKRGLLNLDFSLQVGEVNDVLNGDISVLFPSSVDVGRDGCHGGTCETFFLF